MERMDKRDLRAIQLAVLFASPDCANVPDAITMLHSIEKDLAELERQDEMNGRETHQKKIAEPAAQSLVPNPAAGVQFQVRDLVNASMGIPERAIAAQMKALVTQEEAEIVKAIQKNAETALLQRISDALTKLPAGGPFLLASIIHSQKKESPMSPALVLDWLKRMEDQ